MAGNLDTLRKEIEDIDARIAELIDQRTRVAEDVARVKMEQDLPIVNPQAEERVHERYRKAAERYGLREETMVSVARLLISEAVFREEEIARRP